MSFVLCRVETQASALPMRLSPRQTVRADFPHTAFHRSILSLPRLSSFLCFQTTAYYLIFFLSNLCNATCETRSSAYRITMEHILIIDSIRYKTNNEAEDQIHKIEQKMAQHRGKHCSRPPVQPRKGDPKEPKRHKGRGMEMDSRKHGP